MLINWTGSLWKYCEDHSPEKTHFLNLSVLEARIDFVFSQFPCIFSVWTLTCAAFPPPVCLFNPSQFSITSTLFTNHKYKCLCFILHCACWVFAKLWFVFQASILILILTCMYVCLSTSNTYTQFRHPNTPCILQYSVHTHACTQTPLYCHSVIQSLMFVEYHMTENKFVFFKPFSLGLTYFFFFFVSF